MRTRVEMAAEGRSKIIGVARGIRDEIVAPVIENSAVRIGEAVRHVATKLSCHRLIAKNGAVCVANWTIKRLNVGAVKNAVAQVHRAAGFVADRVRFVMRVSRIQAVQNALLGVGPSTPFAVSHKPKVRRLHDQHPVLVELKTRRTIKSISPRGDLGGLARFGIQIDHQKLVEHLGRRRVFGIIGPRSYPQTSLRIKCHLHWVDELREGFLRGDQLHFATRRER